MRKAIFLSLLMIVYSNVQSQISSSMRWNVSNTFKYAIENDNLDTLKSIFTSPDAFNVARKMILSKKKEIQIYNKGRRINDIQWTDASTIVQTFATVEEDKSFILRFQLTYHCKQVETGLFVDAVRYHSDSEIENKARILEKLKNQLNPPDEVDPN